MFLLTLKSFGKYKRMFHCFGPGPWHLVYSSKLEVLIIVSILLNKATGVKAMNVCPAPEPLRVCAASN